MKEGNTFSREGEGGCDMGNRKQFTQKQKLSILESAKDNGIKEAAKLSGIHTDENITSPHLSVC